MPTLREYIAEMEARRKRLKEAEDRGWRDCIPSERETVAEFEHVLMNAIGNNYDRLIEIAGDLDFGPLPPGVSLAYSRD
jgi:hypothetical protein